IPGANFPAPGNSYFASQGSCFEFYVGQSTGPPNGPFYTTLKAGGGPVVTLAMVLDGLSNTVGFGEWKIGDGNTGQLSLPADAPFIATYPTINGVQQSRGPPGLVLGPGTNPAGIIQWLQACSASMPGSGNAAVDHVVGEMWACGNPQLSQGNLVAPPNPPW